MVHALRIPEQAESGSCSRFSRAWDEWRRKGGILCSHFFLRLILRLLCPNMTNPNIAEQIGWGENTVLIYYCDTLRHGKSVSLIRLSLETEAFYLLINAFKTVTRTGVTLEIRPVVAGSGQDSNLWHASLYNFLCVTTGHFVAWRHKDLWETLLCSRFSTLPL